MRLVADDGLEQMRTAIERRRVEASRHPRPFQRSSSPDPEAAPDAAEMTTDPQISAAPALEDQPVASPSPRKRPSAPSPKRAATPLAKPESTSPEAGMSALNTTYVRPSQLSWLREIRAAALVEGVSVSASDIVRVALDRLKREGAWPNLKEELLREYRARASRKPEVRSRQPG
jgi:hypothetical protein